MITDQETVILRRETVLGKPFSLKDPYRLPSAKEYQSLQAPQGFRYSRNRPLLRRPLVHIHHALLISSWQIPRRSKGNGFELDKSIRQKVTSTISMRSSSSSSESTKSTTFRTMSCGNSSRKTSTALQNRSLRAVTKPGSEGYESSYEPTEYGSIKAEIPRSPKHYIRP